jgi:hypothetical protein
MTTRSLAHRFVAAVVVLMFAAPYGAEVVCQFNPGVTESTEMMDCTPVGDGVASPGGDQDMCCDMTCCAALATATVVATAGRIVVSAPESAKDVPAAQDLNPDRSRRPPIPPPKV